jgi:hypothetical protein
MKKLRVGKKYIIDLPESSEIVIIDVDDGDGWYTVRDLTQPLMYGVPSRPYALNLNLAEKVHEMDDDWPKGDAHWGKYLLQPES